MRTPPTRAQPVGAQHGDSFHPQAQCAEPVEVLVLGEGDDGGPRPAPAARGLHRRPAGSAQRAGRSRSSTYAPMDFVRHAGRKSIDACRRHGQLWRSGVIGTGMAKVVAPTPTPPRQVLGGSVVTPLVDGILRGPEHESEHAGGGAGAVGGGGLDPGAGRGLDGRGEVGAFGPDLVAFGDEQAAGELRRGQGWDRRVVVGLAGDVFLPVRLRRRRGRLLGRHHRVGVVEDRVRRGQPGRRRLLGEADQVAVAGGEVDGQPGGRVRAGRVVGLEIDR